MYWNLFTAKEKFLGKIISNFAVSTVFADGLIPSGARAFAGSFDQSQMRKPTAVGSSGLNAQLS